MKNKHLLLTTLITFACLIGGGGELMGQSSECTYGDNASYSSSSYSPYGGVSKWEYYVFLYDASNVNFDGIITNVSFKGGANVSASDDIHYTMYLKDVPSGTTLSSSTKYATYLDGATLVLPRTSTPAISKDAWNSTALTTSFEHAQGNSLLVLIKADGKTLQHAVYYMSNSNHVWYYKPDVTDDPGTNINGALTGMVPSIKFTYNPIACPKPTELTATNISTNSATLGWTSDAESFNLQYKTADAENWTTVEGINTTSYTLNGILSPKTTYQFQVQAVCSGTPGSYSNPVSFTTSSTLPYTMGFEDSEIDEFNAFWQVVSSSSLTGQYKYAYHTGNRCFRFYSVNASQYLITPQLDATGGSISFYYNKANNNYERTFKFGYSTTTNDVNDFIWDASSTSAVYNKWNEYTNTFPVGTKYIAILSNPQGSSCDLYIDDITINAPSEISSPTDLSVSNVTYNSAQFNWTAGGSETSWKLQYKKTADADWTTIDVSSKPHTISTLDENSTYQWRVAAYIAPNLSDYEAGDNFTIPAQYPAPTGLTTSNIKTSGASFTWNETTGANGYNLRYSVSSPLEWTTVSGLTDETFTIVSGLTGNTGYTVQVQAIYGENTSAWSEYSFTTLPIKQYTSTSEYESLNNWNWNSAWTPNGIPEVNHDVVIEQNAKILSNNTAVANNVTINDGVTLTIRTNAILTCNNITNNGTLVIEDGGQLICNNNPTVTMQKTINDWENTSWYFISSPISTATTPTGLITDNLGSTATEETATYDLYLLDVTQDKEWQNYRQHNFNLTNGMGYLYASKNGTTLSFSGTIQPSNEDIVLSGLKDGFNLVGNPYTCTAYVNQPHYTLSQANDGITSSTVATAMTTPIAPLTGVIINGTPATFSKTAPNPSKGSVGIMLAKVGTRNNATIDNAIVSFNEGSKLEKFYFGNPSANLYIPQDNEEYAIVSSNAQGEIPVNFKANENGQYTITVNPEGVEMNYLHLIDNMTGTNIDLLSTPSYTFSAKTTDYESRFRLLFATNGIEENNSENATFAYINNGEIIVNGEGRIQVMDITGRILVSHNGDTRCVPTTGMAPGVYVVRLINGESVRSQKIVVK